MVGREGGRQNFEMFCTWFCHAQSVKNAIEFQIGKSYARHIPNVWTVHIMLELVLLSRATQKTLIKHFFVVAA